MGVEGTGSLDTEKCAISVPEAGLIDFFSMSSQHLQKQRPPNSLYQLTVCDKINTYYWIPQKSLTLRSHCVHAVGDGVPKLGSRIYHENLSSFSFVCLSLPPSRCYHERWEMGSQDSTVPVSLGQLAWHIEWKSKKRVSTFHGVR